MEKKIEGSLYVKESATWGGHFRYGPDTKCVKTERADLSIVEIIHLGKREELKEISECQKYLHQQ